MLDYTPRQILLFYREALACKQHERADRVVDVNAAADSRAARKLVEALRRAHHG